MPSAFDTIEAMPLSETCLIALQIFFDTAFGAVVIFIFSGVAANKGNLASMAGIAVFAYALWLSSYLLQLPINKSLAYFLCVHVTFVLFLILRFKVSISLAIVSFLLSFFMMTPRTIFGDLSVFLFRHFSLPWPDSMAQRLGWLLTGPIIFFPEYRLLMKPLKELIHNSRTDRLSLLVIVGLLDFLVQITKSMPQSFVISLMFVLLMLSYLFSLTKYAKTLKRNEEHRAQLIAYSAHAASLALYTDSLSNFLEETALLRHDQRHLLALISAYAEAGDAASIQRLVGEKLSLLEAAPLRISSDNAVNAIVSIFLKRALERDVSIAVQQGRLEGLPLPSNDLCLLLSNCLENAIEATASTPQNAKDRTITLFVLHTTHTGIATLTVRNPYAGPVAFNEEGLPVSRRGEGHGFGTKSIRNIAEKHNGMCDFFVDDGMFVFTATFFGAARSAPAT